MSHHRAEIARNLGADMWTSPAKSARGPLRQQNFFGIDMNLGAGLPVKSLKESGFVTLRLQERYLLLLKKS